MYAVKFTAPIENGVVRIPKEHIDLLSNKEATFVVMYDDVKKSTKYHSVNEELNELFANSNNKIQVTYELATNTDEMIEDGIL